MFALNRGITTSTYGPTKTHEMTVEIINDEWAEIDDKLSALRDEARKLGKKVVAAGGAWIEGLE